jgi:hypothetical protein
VALTSEIKAPRPRGPVLDRLAGIVQKPSRAGGDDSHPPARRHPHPAEMQTCSLFGEAASRLQDGGRMSAVIVDDCPRCGAKTLQIDKLVTGDGRPLPLRLASEITREIARLALIQEQIAALERERDLAPTPCKATEKKRVQLMSLNGPDRPLPPS